MAALASTSVLFAKNPLARRSNVAVTDHKAVVARTRAPNQLSFAVRTSGNGRSLIGRAPGTFQHVRGTAGRRWEVSSALKSSDDFRHSFSQDSTEVIDLEGDDIVDLVPPTTPARSTITEKVTCFVKDFVSHVQKPAVIALIMLAVVTGIPDFAMAASSGGRVGGRSFSSGGGGSSSSYSRGYSGGGGGSYSVPSRTYAPSYSAPYYAAPWGNPFGFYSAPTVVVGGGGGGGGIFSFLLFSVGAMFLANLVFGFLSDREGDGGLLGSSTKTSVVRLQVGLLGLARTLQKDLDRIAERADTSTPEGLHYVLTETVLALLRHPDYCIYGRSTTDVKRNVEDGEAAFNAVSLEERGKFREETLVNVGDVKRRGGFTPNGERFQNEYLVVTVVVAAEGELKLPAVNNTADLREALAKLGSVPADQIQAVEILWTPQDEEDTLSERELLTDYPSLRTL